MKRNSLISVVHLILIAGMMLPILDRPLAKESDDELLSRLHFPPPISTETVRLCIKRDGEVYAIGIGRRTECDKKDIVITLNTAGWVSGSSGIQGVKGPTGSTGLQGVTGASGVNGIDGPTGQAGSQGATGIQGESGRNGSEGPTGSSGIQGSPGAQGETGAVGSTGASGASGKTGPTGIQGPTGETGIMGATGPSGAGETGATGVKGASGSTGASGANGVSGYQIVSVSDTSTTDPKILSASCPAGKKVIGGGYSSSTQSIDIQQNNPSSEMTWTVDLNKVGTATEWTATVYAICITAL